MKIAFFWTWDFSRNILNGILNYSPPARGELEGGTDVKLIVSQPDKPIWRKKELVPTPVKSLALEKNIKVLQPEKLKNNTDFFKELEWFDFIVVVAYWKIVPKEVLEAPKYGCINIHWSILPNYRWASPIQESIKNWDSQTGLTIMYMSEWMDEWDILDTKIVNIDKLDKTPDIFKKFEVLWPELLINTLKNIIDKSIVWQKQDDSKATYCSKISKTDWEVFFSKDSPNDIYNKYKAYFPWPGIYTFYNWKKLNIEDCSLIENPSENNIWSVIKLDKKNIWIQCSDNKLLLLKQVKLEWKKSMDILSFLNWNKDFLDYKF